MCVSNQQVLTAYNELGMTPEDIAMDLGWELTAVKMVLLQHSTKYVAEATERGEEKGSVVLNKDVFTEDDFRAATATMVGLLDAEVESVKFKAAEFIINEKQGRNDVKALTGNNFSLVMVSETMARARAAMRDAKRRGVVVDVGTVTTNRLAA